MKNELTCTSIIVNPGYQLSGFIQYFGPGDYSWPVHMISEDEHTVIFIPQGRGAGITLSSADEENPETLPFILVDDIRKRDLIKPSTRIKVYGEQVYHLYDCPTPQDMFINIASRQISVAKVLRGTRGELPSLYDIDMRPTIQTLISRSTDNAHKPSS
jgi:hypothetical protein